MRKKLNTLRINIDIELMKDFIFKFAEIYFKNNEVDKSEMIQALNEEKTKNCIFQFLNENNNLADDFGAVKIVPPKEWEGRISKLNFDGLRETPTFQDVKLIKDDIFLKTHEIFKDTQTIDYYRDLTENDEYNRLSLDEGECLFWSQICQKRNIYGPEVEATLFQRDLKIYNMNTLNDPLSVDKDLNKNIISGVNTRNLYVLSL